MSKEKSPAFQFYAAEYLADENVQLMTIEEEGCYIRLMALCWREGSIPSDHEKLTKLCKGITPSKLVLACFNYPSEDSSRLLHPRHEQERIKQGRWKKKCAEGGKNSAHKRKTTGALIQQQSSSTKEQGYFNSSSSSSIASSIAIPPIVPQGTPNGSALIPLFANFWQAYPRREAKQPAWKAFKRIHPDTELVEKMLKWIADACLSDQWQDKSLIPHASTWLNQRRWEGDPPPKAALAMKQSGYVDLDTHYANLRAMDFGAKK